MHSRGAQVETMVERENIEPSDHLLEKLKELPLLQSFQENDLRNLLKFSSLRKYEPGEYIIDETYFDNCVYLLVSGSVRITKQGKEIRVLKRMGEIFGEMSIIDGASRSASAYAIDDTTCLVTDAAKVKEFSGNDNLVFYSIIYKTFAEILAERLRITTEELVQAKAEIERLKNREKEFLHLDVSDPA